MTFGSGYDAWLERPYVERAERDAAMEPAHEVYMEYHDLDEDDMAEVDDDVVYEWYEEYLQDGADDAAEAAAEARAERDWDFD